MVNIRMLYLDVGRVITRSPSSENWRRMIDAAGIPEELFLNRYRELRTEYDRGALDSVTFWSYIVRGDHEPLPEEKMNALLEADNRCWSDIDHSILRWKDRVRDRGIRTGVLSNMPHTYARHMKTAMSWFKDFDCHVLSCEWLQIKPEPEIYATALEISGTKPGETLFIDDMEENIGAARAAGMHGIVYRGMEDLSERIRVGYDLPEVL